ncbi:toxic anion resistance protein [Pseudomonas savastanoi]|uniref:toxic anion resistance protein n=1 Tax=Pseudomonas savastanoi TaxID=29438 RepID=UPI001F1EDF88|nr:toxic anion resistance protein [Pseudomonas savastanoi]
MALEESITDRPVAQANSQGVSAAVTAASLKATVLPELFANTSRIGEYGSARQFIDKMDELSNLMESGSVGALSSKIAEILTGLSDASPEQITKAPTWLQRLTGAQVEKQVRYQVARKGLEELINEAEGHAQGVRDTLVSINKLISGNEQEVEELRIFIQAGNEYLEENPEAGVLPGDDLSFDKPRERFARKLVNLQTLLSSHQMSVAQMKLSRTQALGMLDRFGETVTLLVPVWRQHTLTLIQTKHMNPAMVKAAAEAHRQLMQSFAESLNSTQH